MTRRPLKLLRHLSLLLCLAAAALWALTRLQTQQLIFTAGARLWWVYGGDGAVSATTVHPWPRPERRRWIRGRPYDLSDHLPLVGGTPAGPLREWEKWGLTGVYGPIKTMVDTQGTPASLTDWSLHDSGRGKPLTPSAAMAYHSVGVPLWMPVLATAAYPLASFARGAARRHTRRRRHRQGRCAHCGYDLKDNISGVCPECGAAP